MKTSRVMFMILSLVLVASLASIWFYPSVHDFMESNALWNGVRDFSGQYGADNVDSLDALDAPGEKDVLVSIPYVEYNADDLSKLRQLVDNGGTLLLMDDFGYGNTVLEYLGLEARFDHNLLLDPLFSYKNQYLPKITDFSPRVKEAGIKTVVLNRATVLNNVSDAAAIAWSSGMSFLDRNQNGVADGDESRGPFVVAAEFRLGKGMVELVSDPSLMINAMTGISHNGKFVDYLIHRTAAQTGVVIDRSHLTKAPLDASKIRLNTARQILSSPYTLMGITALIFIVVTRYTLKRGKTID